MKRIENRLCVLALCALAVYVFAGATIALNRAQTVDTKASQSTAESTSSYIKWVSFAPNYSALSDALKLDIDTYGSERHLGWVDTLAYLACKNGESFDSRYKKSQLSAMLEALGESKTVDELMGENKYYRFYKQAYGAVLGGMVGEFTKLAPDRESQSGYKIIEGYGLKAYHPIAEGFWCKHYDDFGVSREYGFRRRHLGHDLMGSTGTPIVAVEGGTVEVIGWNRYGGWRLGIRSFDGKRSYYYAHLRRNKPYHSAVKLGSTVKAGQVIGYMGMTGYSIEENINGMDVPHLHLGLQLVFDESQKEGNNQIWLDLYALTQLLSVNRATVIKEADGEYYRVYDIAEKQYPEALQHLTTRPAPTEATTQIPE